MRSPRRPTPRGAGRGGASALRIESLESRTLLAVTPLVGDTTPAHVLVPTRADYDDLGLDWVGTAEPFDDSTWTATPAAGPNGVGYNTLTDAYDPYIGANLQAAMQGTSRTAFVRIPFTVTDVVGFDALTLKMRFDDGFIAYLNGVEIQRANVNPALAYPPYTIGSSGPASAGSSFTTYDVSGHIDSLVEGSNVLAVRGFNFTLWNTTFLMQAALDASFVEIPPTANDDAATATTDGPPVTIDVLANDTAGTAAIDPTTVQVVGAPANGTAAVNATTGIITYTPNTGYRGTDTFTYRVRDLTGGGTHMNTAVHRSTTPHRTLVPTSDVLGLTWTGGNEPFNDAAWVAGVGGIGYDTDATVDFTPFINDNVQARVSGINPSIFERIAFTADPAMTSELRLRLRYDDGFIAYVNGVKVAEMNAPETPSHNSIATASNPDTSSIVQQEFVVDVAGVSLREGPNANILAIHLLNQSFGSSDILMETELIAENGMALSSNEATVTVNVTGIGPVAIDDTAETVGRAPVVIPVLANDTTGAPPNDFPLRPESVAIVQPPANGTATVNPQTGEITYRANVGFSGEDSLQYIVRDSALIGGTTTEIILPRSAAEWRYLDTGVDPGGTAWRTAAFDDSAWLVGTAQLGYGDIQTTTTRVVHPTTLFRKTITLSSSDVAELKVRLLRDDGAAVYINGVEIRRDNLAPNAGFFEFSNGGAVGGLDEETLFETTLTAADLQSLGVVFNVGENIVAADVHQDNATSSDIGFDLELEATFASPPGRVSNPATVTIAVASTNDPPTANDDEALTKFEQLVLIDLLANDEPGGALIDADSVAIVVNPSNGSLSIPSNGSVVYVPDAGFVGDDSFSYTVRDLDGRLSNVATTTIRVVTSVPLPADDLYFVDEDDVLNVPVSFGVLENDTDDGGVLVSATVAQPPEHGTLVLAENGSFQYAPAANFFGDDHFRYRATDNFGESAEASVTIRVTPAPDDPTAFGDVFATPTNTPLVVVAAPPERQVLIPAGATWRYFDEGVRPSSSWFQLSYDDALWPVGQAEFGYGDGDEVTVVSWGDDINQRNLATYFRHELLLADASRIHGLRLGLLRDDGAAVYLNGSLVLASNLSSPSSPDTTADSIVAGDEERTFLPFAIEDYRLPSLRSGRNIVAVDIRQASPQSNDMSFDLYLHGDVAGPVTDGVLFNDVDPDGDFLTAVLVSPPANGTLEFSADGGFVYTPNVGFVGADAFTYRANDGARLSDVATVVINVTPPGSLAADLNEDGVVNEADVAMVVAGLGMAVGADKYGGDVNGDGIVDVQDVVAVQRAFGQKLVENAAAPAALVAGRRDASSATDAAIADVGLRPLTARTVRRARGTSFRQSETTSLNSTDIDRAIGDATSDTATATHSLRAMRRR